MSSTWRYIRPLAPSMVSETAIVMIMAMVMVTLRHSPTSTSDRTYFTRIGGSFRVSGMRCSSSGCGRGGAPAQP